MGVVHRGEGYLKEKGGCECPSRKQSSPAALPGEACRMEPEAQQPPDKKEGRPVLQCSGRQGHLVKHGRRLFVDTPLESQS